MRFGGSSHEHTVDDIPAVYLALVVADEGTAMVLDGASQGGSSPGSASDPAWELVVPNTVVAYVENVKLTRRLDILWNLPRRI